MGELRGWVKGAPSYVIPSRRNEYASYVVMLQHIEKGEKGLYFWNYTARPRNRRGRLCVALQADDAKKRQKSPNIENAIGGCILRMLCIPIYR